MCVLSLELEVPVKGKRVLCPYCGCYVDVSEYYSKHYNKRCLNFKNNH